MQVVPCRKCSHQLMFDERSSVGSLSCPQCGERNEMKPALSAPQAVPAGWAPDAAANPYVAPATMHAASALDDVGDDEKYYPLAELMQRFAGNFIDNIIYFAGAFLGGVVFASVVEVVGNTMGKTDPLMAGLAGMLLPLAIQSVLIARDGQSIGKKIMGTRIVDYHTNRHPGFARAVALRLWVPFGLGMIPYANILGFADWLTIFGEERRCLHDYLAGTKVVSVRGYIRRRAEMVNLDNLAVPKV